MGVPFYLMKNTKAIKNCGGGKAAAKHSRFFAVDGLHAKLAKGASIG
jgi:hypothetical protein